MDETIDKIYKDTEFIKLIEDLITNETVIEMKKFRQHYKTSCYTICFYMTGELGNLIEKVFTLLHIQNVPMKMHLKYVN